MTRLTLIDRSGGTAAVDALVVGTVKQSDTAVLASGHGLSAKAVSHLESQLAALDAKGTKEELVTVAGVPDVKAPVVVLVGLGDTQPYAAELLRRAAGAALRSLTGKQDVAISLPTSSPEQVTAVAEGALMGAYTYTAFKSEQVRTEGKAAVGTVHVAVDKVKDKATTAAAERAEVVARSVAYARDLVNMPPNELYPETFAQNVTAFAVGSGITVEVMDEKELQEARCGGLLGVGLGSARPPRLVKLSYRPRGAKQHVALVGKGITFDSGGLCIKPAGSMITMKCDMGGAAAVAGAVMAAAELEVRTNITAYLCLAENMTGAAAQRPGDVVTMHDGQTVEIINTDAEGRLAMADGIAFATEDQPDVIVDIATLTGAAIVALSNRTAAVISNEDDLRTRIHGLATDAGEAFWPMPITEDIRPPMDSQVADFKHTGGTTGGCMTAAAFLEKFVGKRGDQQIAWAHLDIAGPAFNSDAPWGYTPKGGTGFGVRTLLAIAEAYAG